MLGNPCVAVRPVASKQGVAEEVLTCFYIFDEIIILKRNFKFSIQFNTYFLLYFLIPGGGGPDTTLSGALEWW
jgi:hypothetical protein